VDFFQIPLKVLLANGGVFCTIIVGEEGIKKLHTLRVYDRHDRLLMQHALLLFNKNKQTKLPTKLEIKHS